jgi:4-hydroxythreonine-4-phosphate dehydrogenase
MDTQMLWFTPGEPAGIGPDIAVLLAQVKELADVMVVADPDMLRARAQQRNVPLSIREPDERFDGEVGEMRVWPVRLNNPAVLAGVLNPDNVAYVLQCLEEAVAQQGKGAMVTGPVHKGVMNQAGIRFSGHTEFLQQLAGVEDVVMMLANPRLRVALATTHLTLRQVPDAITPSLLQQKLRVLYAAMQRDFSLPNPTIRVAGLNPHAGEGGYLGHEDQDIIAPVLESFRQQGNNLIGPLPADTMFNQPADAYMAMYHDQGLPVLKYAGFGKSVNISLGLPFIRTSVDHGTALELAGGGELLIWAVRAMLCRSHAI